MESKIRIKIGQIEIDFEGSESFLKENLMEFVKATSEIASSSRLAGDSSIEASLNNSIEQDNPNQSGNRISISGTTNNIAAKLNVKKEAELIVAAAVHLTFVTKQDKFHRNDLLKEMQSASSYYKKSYSGGNLSKSLNTLVKSDKITEQSTDMYALSANAIKDLEAKLA